MGGPIAALLRAPPLLLLAAVAAVHVVALGLFSSGFLLTRLEVPAHSACCEPFGFNTTHGGVGSSEVRDSSGLHGSATRGADGHDAVRGEQAGGNTTSAAATSFGSYAGGCWGRKHFKKSVWIVIDALRFDFVAECPGRVGDARGCRSHMPFLLNLTQTSVRVAQPTSMAPNSRPREIYTVDVISYSTAWEQH